MKGILKGHLKDIDLEIYDGVDISENSFMYAGTENKYALSRSKQSLFTDKKVIDLYGHQWTLFYSTLPPFNITSEKYFPLGIIIPGIIISFLIFLLMQSQERTREQALAIANDMTAALRESRSRLEAALASMTDAVFISDAAGQFIEFNDAFASFHRFKNKAECAKKLADYPDILDVFMANGELAPLDMWAVPRALRGSGRPSSVSGKTGIG